MTMSRKPISRRRSRSEALALAAALVLATPAGAQSVTEHQVKPSLADPGVKAFDEPSIALVEKQVAPDAPLAIFLPGTNGLPANTETILAVMAGQGYRVIGLEYDDAPAVVQVCPRDPDPACSARFREMRITGTGPGTRDVRNPSAEAIVPRLVATLKALAAAAPDEGWGQYLDGDQLRWDRILVSGLSQGAGMAAYIAKQHAVRRVVLFSSPWDFTLPERRPAEWLATPSATPMTRWFAEYNKRENTAPLIRAAYAALKIPSANISAFDLDLPPNVRFSGENPYHGATIHDPRYAPQWRAMFGKASDPAG
jgi:pimeloyl-ACP methyl ester carboxylesterase